MSWEQEAKDLRTRGKSMFLMKGTVGKKKAIALESNGITEAHPVMVFSLRVN